MNCLLSGCIQKKLNCPKKVKEFNILNLMGSKSDEFVNDVFM